MLFCSSVATYGSAIATGSRGGTDLRSRTRCAHATIIPASNAENSANDTNVLADTLYIRGSSVYSNSADIMLVENRIIQPVIDSGFRVQGSGFGFRVEARK